MALIDGDRLADSIHRELCGHITCNDCPFRTEDGGCEVERWLDDAPVVEPKQGEWIDKGWHGDWQFETDGRGNCWHEYECSECGFRKKGSKSNYCPDCGVKMKGKDNE